MPAEKVRWGLLSTARINRRVMPAIRASKRGELAAVASRDADNARAYAQKWKIPHSFGSYEALLDSGEVDAVYISLPNHLHAEWTVRALDAGLHVLCEKPFAVTLEEVDRMAAAARANGRVLAEAFMYRHHPQIKTAGEWAHSGRLGEIRRVSGFFSFRMEHREGNVRLEPEYGGGSLWDVGVYPLSFAQYIFGGPPLRVNAFQWVGPTGVDEDFSGQMEYAGGGLAQIGCSFQTPFTTYVEVLGTAGRLTISRPFTNVEESQVLFHPPDGRPQKVKFAKQELYLGEVEDLHAAILDGQPTYLSLQESRDHVKTVLALYEAARSGRTVEVA